MKNKQGQIEEMAKERNEIKDIMKLLDKCTSLNPMCKAEVATVVYGNNYRKASEVIDEFVEKIICRLSYDRDSELYDKTKVALILNKIAAEMRQEVEK